MGDADDISPVEIRRIEARWKSDIELKIDDMNRRLRTIERLVWTAVGGTAIITAMASVGILMLLDQSKHVDAIAIRQAAAIAERTANEASLRAKDAELQAQIDRLASRR